TPRLDKDPFGPSVTARYAPGLVPQGISAELIAHRWGQSREELDAYSARSHHRAAAAAADGSFDREIVPIRDPKGNLVAAEETIRPGTTVEVLAGLPPAFATNAWTQRFPELDFAITAGNSSQLTDGASAILVASEPCAQRLGLTPWARVLGSALCG